MSQEDWIEIKEGQSLREKILAMLPVEVDKWMPLSRLIERLMLPQPTVSRMIKKLEEENLVIRTKQGRHVYLRRVPGQ